MTGMELDLALSRGIQRVLERRRPDGFWLDFRTEAGRSDEWVTGFATFALSHCEITDEHLSISRLALVRRQRKNGGWAYNKRIPADCDSTGWVLLALADSAQRPSVRERARRFQIRHQNEADGGFSTYIPEDQLQAAVHVPSRTCLAGWEQSQPCVTALVAKSLLANGEAPTSDVSSRAATHLLSRRLPSGLWPSFWWAGHAYSTYLCLSALWAARCLGYEQARKTISFIVQSQRADGGWNDGNGSASEVFATAFSTLSLMLFPELGVMDVARRGIEWLTARQADDGSWPTCAILRIDLPLSRKPDEMTLENWKVMQRGTQVVVPDSGIYSGCGALWAMATYRRLCAS